MPTVFLIGRHGAGKSTLGRSLALAGFHHVSVGVLKRLARKREYPKDIPVRLMLALGRQSPSEGMAIPTAMQLIEYAAALPACAVDGFPTKREHLSLLPPDALVFHVWTPRTERSRRLTVRAATSARQWTPGPLSARDLDLCDLLWSCRALGRMHFIRNDGAIHSIAGLAQQVIAKSAAAPPGNY